MEHGRSLASRRLQRLLAFLREDPANPKLLAESWDEAMAAADHACAESLLQAARELGADPADWEQRTARLAIATSDWARAGAALDRAATLGAPRCALLHDRAIVLFGTREYDACRVLLEGALAACATADPALVVSLRRWWIRASHHAGHVREAFAWICAAGEGAGAIDASLLAPASLVALDAGDFRRAKALSDAALAAGRAQVDALVARACVALAEADADGAMSLLKEALALAPDEGRTWSALGMARLQARDLSAARVAFERATQAMPAHIGSWHGLGWACLLLQDRAGALAAFEQALARDRNFAESHGALGLVLVLLGRRDEAEAHIAVAGRLDRQNVTGRFARAVANGESHDAQAMAVLAARLLDRPGFFGGRLSDSVRAQVSPPA